MYDIEKKKKKENAVQPGNHLMCGAGEEGDKVAVA